MADYQYVTDTGVIVPDTSTTQAQVEAEFRAAFGANLVVTPNTPQGVLIAAEVTARQAVARNNAALANQINPDQAAGVFLDALWRLTGGARRVASQSVLRAVALTGQPGTLVPAGSLAKTAAGDVFASVSAVTLGPGGTAAVDFVAQAFGPVPATVGALNIVVSAVLGWESVANGTGAELGLAAETDAAARRRRRATLALQGVSLPEAITSGLYDTPGVRSLKFRENVTAAAAVIDGVNLVANSIYVCVDGGTDLAVATTLLGTRSLGAQWNGGTTVNVVEPASGQSYAVKFDRPTPVPILVRATVRNVSAIGDPVDLTRAAILAYVQGLMDGEAGFTVGAPVSPFELAGAVNRQQPGLYVQKLEVTLASVVNYQVAEILIAINQIASLADGSITVLVV